MRKIALLIGFTIMLIDTSAVASPYGPTLNQVSQRYAVTRNFGNLNDYLEREDIEIRLGMTVRDVERWASQSRVYKVESRKGSIWKFKLNDNEESTFALSFEVWFAKGEVVVIKTFNVNNFEYESNDLKELKALRPVRINECWVKRNFVDPNSFINGFDFALGTELKIPLNDDEGCIGSARANMTIGKPGTLYPKHIKQ